MIISNIDWNFWAAYLGTVGKDHDEMQLRSWIKAELHKLDQDRCVFFHVCLSPIWILMFILRRSFSRLILEQFEITFQTDQIQSAKKKTEIRFIKTQMKFRHKVSKRPSHMQLPSVLDNLPKDSRLTGWKGKRGSSTRIWHESWGTTNRHFLWCFKWKRICIKWIQSKSSIGTILSREPFSQLRLMVCSFELSPEGWYWLGFCGLLLLLFYGVDTG